MPKTFTVLDTSAVHEDYFLKGPNLVLLLGLKAELEIDVYLPQIVLDELRSQFDRKLRALANKARSAIVELERFQIPTLGDITGEGAAKVGLRKLQEHLVKHVPSTGIHVLPYPTPSHQDLARRAMAGKKPFAGKDGARDRGYRDALIWESVRALLKATPNNGAFVTSNTSDFCLNDGLHPDLISDLRLDGIDPSRLRHFHSLESVVKDMIIPQLQAIKDITALFASDRYTHFNLRKWLHAMLPDILRDRELPRMGNMLMVGVVIKGARFADKLTVHQAIRLAAQQVWVRVAAFFRANVEPKLSSDQMEEKSTSLPNWIRGSAIIDLTIDENDGSVEYELSQWEIFAVGGDANGVSWTSAMETSTGQVEQRGRDMLELAGHATHQDGGHFIPGSRTNSS